jgi:hypothetical protein
MSTGDYAKSVGLGAATGAASTIGGGFVFTLPLGGGSAVINEAGNQMIKTGKVNDAVKVSGAGASGLTGGFMGKVGNTIGKNFGRITPPKETLINSIFRKCCRIVRWQGAQKSQG